MRIKRTTALALSMLVMAVIMYVFSLLAHAQDIHPAHPTIADFEDNIRLMTVEVTSTDERLIYWKREMKMQVRLGSFGWDKFTRFDRGKQPGCYLVLYCVQHDFALLVIPCKEKGEK